MKHGFISRIASHWGLAIAIALSGAQFAQPVGAATLSVFAAASLKNALDDAAARYREHSRDTLSIAYGASSALARQIENGAPADIFISADLGWMDYVAERGLIKPGSRINLLRNEIVLIAPASSAVRVELKPGFDLAGLLGSGRLAMADPDYVPAGRYGKAALRSLGVWPSVAGKIARGENVRAALNFVSRGEAPLGIVYRTDAEADGNVRVVAVFPAGSHPPVVYPAALLKGGKRAAEDFFAFLTSPAASDIFRKYGFSTY